MGEEDKNEGQILFPGIEVDGIQIRPWSLKQFFSLTPLFGQMSESLKDKGIGEKSFQDLLEGSGGFEKLMKLLTDLGPFIPEVIGKTVGLPVEEVEAMDFDKAISIALVILIQNAERIKNFSGLAQTAAGSLIKAS